MPKTVLIISTLDTKGLETEYLVEKLKGLGLNTLLMDYGELADIKERELLLMLAGFPEVFEDAVNELKPGSITSYANGLADKFNSFYAALPVIRAESETLVGARLKLVDAVRMVLGNALSLLGIKAPERM